jgi:hypothetical protein
MTGRTLLTIRPGPALHLWQDGREVARVPLDLHAALALAEALLRELRTAHVPAGGPQDGAGAAARGRRTGGDRQARGGYCGDTHDSLLAFRK